MHRQERSASLDRAVARLSSAIAILALALLAPGNTRAAGTFYVDNSAPCSNNGPGTEAQPYCTITAALTKQGGPGTTILVKPGVYREQVTVPVSGAPGDPLVIRALGLVAIDGSDPFSNSSLWTQFSGDVWVTPISWSPVQVRVNGFALTPSTDDPALLAPMTFRYVTGQGLYVNAGGGNPGDRETFVGHRLNGFHLNGKSWVVIQDFQVTRCEEKGIELEGGSANCEIRNNAVTLCASSGISMHGSADVVVESNRVSGNCYHGIALTGGSTGCHIRDNECSWNVDEAGTVATGIYLNASPDNRIERNRLFRNADTGLEIQGGSDNCLSIQNVSHQNGDHGFQHLLAVGTINIGNVAWSNHSDGFSIEGTALNTSLHNCIGIDNGVTASRFNLFVDAASTAGMVSDYNIFWNSGAQKPIKYNGVQYATVGAYSTASGLDANTVQANALFLDPSNGWFHVAAGSPAIDSGTSGISNWPSTDAQNNPREDDPAVTNSGAGGILYADRGAFEFRVSTVGVGGPTAPDVSFSSVFPNPGRGTAAFLLSLPRDARVEWGVFDLQGRKLGGGERWHTAGRSAIQWDEPRGNGGGVRFARVSVEGKVLTRRFVTLP
jgi:parallel beta-helix repeat protein